MYRATIEEDGVEVASVCGRQLDVVRREVELYAHQYLSDFKKVFKIEIKEIESVLL
jgi:hypothetical protein